MSAPLRILGIDPGLNRTGYGVIDCQGDRLSMVAAGVINVPAGSLPERIACILRELQGVIVQHQPTVSAIEQVFVNVNPKATLLLGQARGAALCAAVGSGLAVHEYSALQVKQAVVGYGKANKEQVQAMVVRLLSLTETPSTDAADALACALCHAHSRGLKARLKQALASPTTSKQNAAGSRRAGGSRSRAAWAARIAHLNK